MLVYEHMVCYRVCVCVMEGGNVYVGVKGNVMHMRDRERQRVGSGERAGYKPMPPIREGEMHVTPG